MRDLVSSSDQIQVEATAGAVFPGECVAILMHEAGTLSHTRPDGTTRTLTDMPAGLHLIKSKAILAATTVKVTCFFN